MNDQSTDQKIREWLFFAEEDLKLANIALEAKIFHGACFHAQQAVEKTIKAYLFKKHGKVRKIHHLTGLLDTDLNIKQEFSELMDSIEFLDQFYIPTRYPDAFPGSLPEGLPTEEDARKALDYAQQIVDFIKGKLNAARS